MKVVFFGSPTFSVPFLQALLDDSFFEVVGVVTQPDKPAGRGGVVQPTPTKQLAIAHGLPVSTPVSLKRDPSAVEGIARLHAEVFVVVAYGKLLPNNLLSIPPRGVVNVHPSLLPRHRGPSPMQWAIKEGDSQTGVSIMLLDEGMDTGPILAQVPIDIDEKETSPSLERKVTQMGPDLLVETLKRSAQGVIVPTKQDETKATVTRLLQREDGHIDWHKSATTIDREYRAFQPWPGSWSLWQRADGSKVRLKLVRLAITDLASQNPPGTMDIRDHRLFVATTDRDLEIVEIQPEAKAAMSAAAFIAGYPEIAGRVLT